MVTQVHDQETVGSLIEKLGSLFVKISDWRFYFFICIYMVYLFLTVFKMIFQFLRMFHLYFNHVNNRFNTSFEKCV